MKHWTLTLVFSSLLFFPVSLHSKPEPKRVVPTDPVTFAKQKLSEEGVSPRTIQILEGLYLPEDRDRIVALNVFGFLAKADYSGHFSSVALKRCRDFLKKHQHLFVLANKRTGVDKEVIASLLWVETKLGKRLGSNSVPHVYFSLVQADHPEVIKATLGELPNRMAANESEKLGEYQQKVIDRSYAKANWALREVKSLDQIQKTNAKNVEKLFGSYAGAFGIPQFIPSSYLHWARGRQNGKAANLFDVGDAIYSVAFYLKVNGWKAGDREAQRAALFHYNRSEGYVNIILKLAQTLKDTTHPLAPTKAVKSSS